MTSHPFLTRGRPDLLGHRGASADRPPGNSLAAFQRALDVGCDHIETDVQLSADGVVVIFHDPTLDEATTGTGRIADHAWSQLAELRYRAGGRTTDDGLVRLDDALATFPDAYFNIDVKKDEAIEPVVDILRAAGARERVCIAAFGWRRLRRLRRALGSGWCSACSRPEIAATRVLSWIGFPTPRWGDAIQVPERRGRIRVVDDRFVRACHRAGMQVHVWTVDDLDAAHRLRAVGIDAVITDDPAGLDDWRREP